MYLWEHMSERSLCDKYTAKRQLLPLFSLAERPPETGTARHWARRRRIKTTGM
jgi:hypothetical protein